MPAAVLHDDANRDTSTRPRDSFRSASTFMQTVQCALIGQAENCLRSVRKAAAGQVYVIRAQTCLAEAGPEGTWSLLSMPGGRPACMQYSASSGLCDPVRLSLLELVVCRLACERRASFNPVLLLLLLLYIIYHYISDTSCTHKWVFPPPLHQEGHHTFLEQDIKHTIMDIGQAGG